MTTRIRLLAVVVVGLVGLLITMSGGVSADDEKGLLGGLEKIVTLLEKKDYETVKKEAKTLSENEGDPEAIMELMEPRSVGGLGVGKPGQVKPDGIEDKLVELATKAALTDMEFKAQGEAIKRMGLQIAAIAEVSRFHGPMDKKKAAKWSEFNAEMRGNGLKLAEAKTPADVKTVASKLNGACKSCHDEFK